jgi:Domain of unknown function (DUF3387)
MAAVQPNGQRHVGAGASNPAQRRSPAQAPDFRDATPGRRSPASPGPAEDARGDPAQHAGLAFYDTVAHQGMARALMGDDMLAKIARTLVADIRKNLSVDWLSREPVRAKLRTRIRRLLAKFDYPPEERAAVDLVIKQMETFANEWAPEAPR